MDDGIEIRPALPIDASEIIEMLSDLQDYERWLHQSRRPGSAVAHEHYQRMTAWAAGSDGAVLVAIVEEEVVGVVSGWMAVDNDPLQEVEYQRYGYVSDIFVSSKVRGKWLATKLLKSIEDHLREVGARRLRIGSLARNAAAVAAYRNFGYEPFEVVLEKDLDKWKPVLQPPKPGEAPEPPQDITAGIEDMDTLPEPPPIEEPEEEIVTPAVAMDQDDDEDDELVLDEQWVQSS